MVSAQIHILLLFAVVLAAIESYSLNPSPRIINGIPVDTPQLFPWHVSIRIVGKEFDCSGTIIHLRWILTSQGCVSTDALYEISFKRLSLEKFNGSFSIIVDRSAVVDYPTGYDNLALIKLPISLTPNANLTVAKLETVALLDNSLVVMPGFGNETTELTYGFFQILPVNDCRRNYGDDFNEYVQMCTRPWGYIGQAPCDNNKGGGLIIDWPANPRLIGIFTNADKNCDAKQPALYTNLHTYIDWINDVLKYK